MSLILLQMLGSMSLIGVITYLYRMHGGAPPKLPWKLDEIFIGCLVTLPAVLLALKNNLDLNSILCFTGAVFLSTAILKTKGHGQYMNLKFLPPWPRTITPETWDIFLKPVLGIDPRTTKDWTELHHSTKAKRLKDYGLNKLLFRCLSGLFISGSSVSLGLVVFLCYSGEWLNGILTFMFFGFSKSLGYYLGWKYDLKLHEQVDEPTEFGEAFSGFGASLIITYLTLTFLYI